MYTSMIRKPISIAVLCYLPLVSFAETETPPSYQSLISDGKVSLNLRYRFENVDIDSGVKDANASTLRSRLTVQSGSYKGLSFLAEVDDVSTIGNDNYNSTENGKTKYAVVADPEDTEINQVYANFKYKIASFTYGRQRILHGDQRFIGGVGWRQNEQTYDGFRALMKTDFGLTFDYSYVYNVNRIFGPDDSAVQPANHDGDNHFIRVDYKISPKHSLSAFSYLLDVDEDKDYAAGKTVGNSTDTYGLLYQGSIGPVNLKATAATQSDAGDSKLDFDTEYYQFEAGYKMKGMNLKAGYEELGSDNNVGFKTPYATLHKFQGWADKFLVTPGDGIEDVYFGVTGAVGGVKLGAFYHDFSAESSSDDFGKEVDLVATWPVNKNLSFQLKAAHFESDEDSRFADTKKLWFTIQFKI